MTTPTTAVIETLTCQPAAPTRTNREYAVDPRSVCGVLRQFLDDKTKTTEWLIRALHSEGLFVTSPITAAEQRVLDGMRDANKFSLLELANTPIGAKFGSLAEPCRAELARREGK